MTCAERSASIRQHTSAYVSIRQHTSAYVSIRQRTWRSASRQMSKQTSASTSRRHASVCWRMPLLICWRMRCEARQRFTSHSSKQRYHSQWPHTPSSSISLYIDLHTFVHWYYVVCCLACTSTRVCTSILCCVCPLAYFFPRYFFPLFFPSFLSLATHWSERSVVSCVRALARTLQDDMWSITCMIFFFSLLEFSVVLQIPTCCFR